MNKRITLILTTMLLLVVSGYAKPKTTDLSGSKFGIEAGYSHKWIYPNTSLMLTAGGQQVDSTAKATLNLDGFYVGPAYTYFFNSVNGLFVRGSIIYEYGRCANVKKEDIDAITFDLMRTEEETRQLYDCDKLSYTAHSLSVPIRIGYNFVFKNGIGFQVFVGPTFNFALDWKLTGEKDGVRYDLNQLNGNIYIKDGENSSTYATDAKERAVYNVFDVGIGGGVGFTYNFFYLDVICDWGLTNICKTSSLAGKLGSDGLYVYTNKASQTSLKVGIGFRF